MRLTSLMHVEGKVHCGSMIEIHAIGSELHDGHGPADINLIIENVQNICV